MCDSSLCILAKLGALPDGSVNIYTPLLLLFSILEVLIRFIPVFFLNALLTVCIKFKQLSNEKSQKNIHFLNLSENSFINNYKPTFCPYLATPY